jgi:hypothetical protein
MATWPCMRKMLQISIEQRSERTFGKDGGGLQNGIKVCGFGDLRVQSFIGEVEIPARLCNWWMMCVPVGRERENTGGAPGAREAGAKCEGGDCDHRPVS